MFKWLYNAIVSLVRPTQADDFQDFPTQDSAGKSVLLGMRGGRSSVDRNAYLSDMQTPLTPDFTLAYLPELNKLSIYHQDFSKAVQNCIDLANTKQEIFFDDSVSERQARKMRAYLEESEKRWNDFGNSTTLVNSLVRQAIVYGAISHEAVPTYKLDGIERVVSVTNEDIVFFYENGNYAPYQILRNVPATKAIYSVYNKLNPNTYKYIPLVKATDTPYGIPPFIAAVMPTEIQGSMVKNFKDIVKRLGAFGFLDLSLEQPEPFEGESEEDYTSRVIAFRDQQSREVKEGVNEGYVVGFKGVHDFKISGNGTNAANADKMFGLVDTLVATGLKQDPSLLGRNRTVTETFGRVILQLQIAQTETIQRCVAEFLSYVRLLDLRLAGFNVRTVTTVFDPPLPGDKIKDEQVRELKIRNATTLYNQGIISQTQFAQELGYDNAFAPAPVANNTLPNPTPIVAGDSKTEPSATNNSQSLSSLVRLVNQDVAPFEYAVPNEYLSYEDKRTKWADPKTQKFSDDYIDSIEAVYSKAVGKIAEEVGKAYQDLPKNTTQSEAQETLQIQMLKSWLKHFGKPIKPLSQKSVKDMYEYYRKDESIFPKPQTTENSSFASFPPKAVLDLADKRAIEWLQNHDITFLSKFITDADTIKRVTDFINKFHLEQGEAIGDNETVLNDFIKAFGEVLDLERWKIRRILDTSVNKVRSYANVNYMSQANVAEFKVVEVMDRITCPHCKAMNNRVFSVSITKDKIEKVVKSEMAEIGTLSPFATSIPIADLEKMTDKEIQAKGIDATPFHPSCRGTLVAVL